MASFAERMIRAAQLDLTLYEEVEADKGAFGQAMAVVILSSIATGIGSFGGSFTRIVLGTVIALVSWHLWAFIIYVIGAKLLPEAQTRADYGQLLRTTGFSNAPSLIRIAGALPGIGGVIYFGASVWTMAAMVIATRQALDYKSTLRAFWVCLIGGIVYITILVGALVILNRRMPV